ncbi:snRNA transcription by RNA polymerase II [Desmophyllum pertusum]|uniref:snRNA transcription by RNA polymerase II n=1 Tax=Desmophyllum pertusum TaxID=174260 RepID=A0A9X0D4I1_9CNID|nr:snRNA transcription by RNA polymerase II [Desmophyllum pertusum]
MEQYITRLDCTEYFNLSRGFVLLENSINAVNGLDSPEFMRKYKLITTYEQRCLYKKDFQTEYEEYKALKEKIDSVSTKFTELQSKRLQFPVKSTERQTIDAEILEHYEQIQKDPLWQPTKKRCHDLHTKLTYIKGLISAYDKSDANT